MNLNKIIIYSLLLLTYLGLSKSLSPSEFGISYVFNEESLSSLIKGAPVSVILVDTHSTGFIIKTYYQKYKVVYGFQTYEELIVRTSRAFTQKNKDYIGMSIFRRSEDLNESFTPLPPGSVFIGNRDFGRWRNTSKGKVWSFYRAYRYIPQYTGLKSYTATYNVFQQIQKSVRDNTPFFGFNDEFGTKGSITKREFPAYFKKDRNDQFDLKDYFSDIVKRNFRASRGAQ
ncbi:MAG: hypothetical protein CME64_06765 [Halobacteriovoraceae bacterium]|nr:hypothetical protein [Halobacteriovoraceae bacterium]|tara:strand:- start:24351 stop:25037 length:687 start_codon:yes stop_codon:yes gene_type:complete